MKKIHFATSNKDKLKEARSILGIDIEPLSIEVDEVQILDPIVCVEKKAEYAFAKAQTPLLVEDTSLFFEAWNGLPGVFIDYFMKSVDVDGLLKLLKDEQNRHAKAQTSLCYFDGKKKVVAIGIIEGTITNFQRGKNGFGWDPIFIPRGANRTFAEMDSEEKNSISMRKLALMDLKNKLQL